MLEEKIDFSDLVSSFSERKSFLAACGQAAEDAVALWQELGMKRQEAIEHLGVAQWHVEEEQRERER